METLLGKEGVFLDDVFTVRTTRIRDTLRKIRLIRSRVNAENRRPV